MLCPPIFYLNIKNTGALGKTVSKALITHSSLEMTCHLFPPPYDQTKIGNFSNLEMSGVSCSALSDRIGLCVHALQ